MSIYVLYFQVLNCHLQVKIAIERGNFEILRMLAQMGFVISLTTSGGEGRPIDSEHACAVQKFLMEVPPVRPLKQMCRKVIRKRIGFGIHDTVDSLPLPLSLKNYIAIEYLIH